MGTFDILNLRLNGYDFHIDLLSGKEKWTDPRVIGVFEAWWKLIPFCTEGYAGLTWQQACDTLVRAESPRALPPPSPSSFRLVRCAGN